MLLTIGQLAEHCGVTVRAIRHYHARGLLKEPARDASGYRRYDAQAVVDLIRIKVLADAGVPLAQVSRLIAAEPREFEAAVAGIDAALEEQIGQLERRRRQLAGLLAGDRLLLPAEVAEMLEELRSMGTSGRGVEIERDGWILLSAVCPELVGEWASQKRAALADPEFRRLYLACDEAREWDAGDPRLEGLAAWMVDWTASRRDTLVVRDEALANDPAVALVEQLMAAQLAATSPAWRRLGELSRSALSRSTGGGLDQRAGSTG